MPKRRVVFCTYPSVYSDLVFAALLRSDQLEVVGVVCSTRVLSKRYGHLRAAWRQIRRSGLRYATYLFAVTDVYRFVQRVLRRPTLRDRAKHVAIPVLETNDINADESVAWLRAMRPDFLVSAHFNQLIKPNVLQLPTQACVNLHPSLLPANKGVDPAFYALLRQEEVAGITVHVQDEAFDTGGILHQQRVSIEADDSLLVLNTRLFSLGGEAMAEVVAKFDHETKGVVQEVGGNYDSWPDPQQVTVFQQRRRLFRWRELFDQ